MRGVSAQKEDVHHAISNVDKGIFPNAFCKIVEDYIGNDDSFCNISCSKTLISKGLAAFS